MRELQFTKPLVVSILSERRAFQPFGLLGGGPGARGMNLLVTSGGRTMNLGGKNTVGVDPGDRLIIMSPGGGGYGAASESAPSPLSNSRAVSMSSRLMTSGSLNQYSLDQEST